MQENIFVMPFMAPVVLAAVLLAALGVPHAVASEATGESTSESASQLTKPLWEVGVGAGFYDTPAYPSADDQITAGLVFPYAIYRGDVWSVGEEGGLRALTLTNNRFELDVSLDVSPASDAQDDADRKGMPNLDFLLELGPQLIFHAVGVSHKKWYSQFDIKLRTGGVFATDFKHFDSQGMIVESAFVYELKSRENHDLEFLIDLEILYGSERLNDYFFEVGAQYATTKRPQYDARQGYIGTELGFGLSLPINDRLHIFAGFDVEFYDGSANQESPLFKSTTGYSGGIAFVYTWLESTERATRR